MAELIQSSARIQELCRHRQAAEIALAKSLYQAFSTGAALNNIQTVACRVLAEIKETWNDTTTRVWGECAILDIFKRFPTKSIDDILAGQAKLTPSDCADVFYIGGEWILAGGGTKGGAWPAKEVLGSYKAGAQSQFGAQSGTNGWAANKADEAQQSTWKTEVGGRYRGKWDGGIEAHIQSRLGPATVNGINLKRSMNGSTVLKVDRIFGLLRGADISGSTAEASLILERWGSDLLHSAYYLLPLATLVYNGHHTLYEVALTMSINNLCDYHIGFYTSLLPGGVPQELSGIENALSAAENNAKHFLIFHEGTLATNGMEFNQAWEKNLLKSSPLTSATEALVAAQQFSSHPTRNEVLSHMQRTAPNLKRSIPDELNTAQRIVLTGR